MTKVVSSTTATPGQVHELYLQIEKVLKGTKNPYETMSKLLKSKVFEKAAREYVNQNCSVVSEKFEPTEFIVSTTPTGNTYSIGKDRKKLIATKEDGGLFDYVDNDIAGWFPEVSFTDTESVSGKVQLFKNNITHRNIITEGEKLGIYQEYELGHALLLANQLVTVGALERKGYGIIIYLKERKDNIRYRLSVWRSGSGELLVSVSEVDPGSEWYAGSGVLFSN